MLERLIEQIAAQEGITERLKEEQPFELLQHERQINVLSSFFFHKESNVPFFMAVVSC